MKSAKSKQGQDMNSITEDQETVNEELQSANEELQRSSEELQNLNKEIETSREEIQSVNEELTVVNSELNSANEDLTDERDYANRIIMTVREPFVVLDGNLNVRSANRSFFDTFRVNEKETEGKSIYELGTGQWDIAPLRKLLDLGTTKINVVDFEVSIDFPSIGKRHMLLNAREIVKQGGKENLILLAMEDITVQRKAEAILRDNEDRFRQLVKDLPAAVYSCDVEGRITFFNQAAVKMWGREPDLVKDRWCGSWKMINTDGSQLPADLCPMAIAFKEQRAIVGEEITLERPDGTRSIVQVYPQPLFGLAGETLGAINMAVDVTEQRRASDIIKVSEENFRQLNGDLEKTVFKRTSQLQTANEKLLEQNSQLVNLNKELESFAYISSHDLQEPLRKIQIHASRIMKSDVSALSEQGKDSFTKMQSSAMRMQSLIRDLLSYTRSSYTARKFVIKDIRVLVEEVLEELQEIIDEKHATVEVTVTGKVSIIPHQFHQLIHNLLSNSLKFSLPETATRIQIKSDRGTGAELQMRNQDLDPGKLTAHKNYYYLSLSDNGIGFDPRYKDKIFEVFQRLHVSEMYPGTGIGLAIVKRIAENHNGIVMATGKLNHGTTFHVYIQD